MVDDMMVMSALQQQADADDMQIYQSRLRKTLSSVHMGHMKHAA